MVSIAKFLPCVPSKSILKLRMTYWEDLEMINMVLYNLLKDDRVAFGDDIVFLIPMYVIYEIGYLIEILDSWDENVSKKSINKELCESLPVTNKLNEQCSICHDDLNTCIELPCHHYFHKNCIIPWFSQANTCPICRVEFIEHSNTIMLI